MTEWAEALNLSTVRTSKLLALGLKEGTVVRATQRRESLTGRSYTAMVFQIIPKKRGKK